MHLLAESPETAFRDLFGEGTLNALLRPQLAQPQSGRGPMNYRTNIIEALLLHMHKLPSGGREGAALLSRAWDLTTRHVNVLFAGPQPTQEWTSAREPQVLEALEEALTFDKPGAAGK